MGSKGLLVVALIALSGACGGQRPILERPRGEDIVAAVRPDLPPPPRQAAEPVPVAPTLRAMGTVSFECVAVGSGEGDFDPEDLRRVLRAQETFFRDCFDRVSEAQPDLAAQVATRFTIDDTGGVDGVSVSSRAPRVERSAVCVASVLRSLRFDVPPQGGSVAVEVDVAYAPPSR